MTPPPLAGSVVLLRTKSGYWRQGRDIDAKRGNTLYVATPVASYAALLAEADAIKAAAGALCDLLESDPNNQQIAVVWRAMLALKSACAAMNLGGGS